MLDLFNQFSSNPIVLFLAIIIFAWLWEDGALIGGALLAANGDLSLSYAVCAVLLGIVSGDLGLYGLGVLARRWRGIRARFYRHKQFRKLRVTFKQKTISNILIIRFVPGLRTVGFSLCGLWGVPFYRFCVVMIAAAILWVGCLFSVIYFIGTSGWLIDSNWKWALGGVAIALLLINNLSTFKRA